MVHDVTERTLGRDIVVSTFHPSLKIGTMEFISKVYSKDYVCITSREDLFNYQASKGQVSFTTRCLDHRARCKEVRNASNPTLSEFKFTVGLQVRIVWMCVAMQYYRCLH